MIAKLLWLVAVLLIVDAYRRPGWHWTAADRQRTFWTILLVLMAPLTLWFYLVGVLPSLIRAAGSNAVDPGFVKNRAPDSITA
ncbi:MAG: hypothetical protein IPJ14_14850 [Kineosporiaceae bacterium]|nr:hypothetical protein [Kineosporiaceae bacterium]MBK7623896.1 hypothetical protein [Kineosporiaceae bacterium]